MGREKKPEQGAGLPQRAFMYAPPRPTPRETEHRTLELKRVRLAPEIDPRHQRTQRLQRGPAPVAGGSVSRRQVAWLAAVGALIGAGTWGVTGFWSDASGLRPRVGGETGVVEDSRVGGNAAQASLPAPAVAAAGETRLLPLHHVPVVEAPRSVRASVAPVVASAPAALNRPELAAAAGNAGRAAERSGVQPREASPAGSGSVPAEASPRAWVLPREPEVWLK